MKSASTASGAAPSLDDIQAYLAGSIRPVPRSPGISQLLSIQKKAASASRENISVGRLLKSSNLDSGVDEGSEQSFDNDGLTRGAGIEGMRIRWSINHSRATYDP